MSLSSTATKPSVECWIENRRKKQKVREASGHRDDLPTRNNPTRSPARHKTGSKHTTLCSLHYPERHDRSQGAVHQVLTQRAGTRLARLTCEGENMWSCCRQEMALAWTRQSGLACITPHPTRQLERREDTAAPSPDNTTPQVSLRDSPPVLCVCRTG